jgi:hypothetical protein
MAYLAAFALPVPGTYVTSPDIISIAGHHHPRVSPPAINAYHLAALIRFIKALKRSVRLVGESSDI